MPTTTAAPNTVTTPTQNPNGGIAFNWQNYQAPNVTASPGTTGTQNFLRPEDSKLPTGMALENYLTNGGIATPDQITNRTVKFDGGLTREQMANQTGFLNNQMGSGFNQTNQNLNTVNNNVTEGIAGVNTNLGTLNGNLNTVNTGVTAANTGIANVNTGMNTGFANQAGQLTTGFNGLKDQLTAAQKAVLDSNQGQTTQLNQIGTKQDTYYGDLANKATGIAGQVTGMQGGFDDYTEQYGKDQTRQTQANARIEGGLAGGFNQVNGQIQQQGQQQRQAQTATMTSGVGGGQLNQVAPQGYTIADTAKAIFTGTPATQNDIASRQQFVVKLNQARQMAAQNPQLQDFANSFDNNGKLIADTQDASGRIARAIDGQGNLVIARLDPMGQVMAQNAYNLEQTLGQVQAPATPYQVQ